MSIEHRPINFYNARLAILPEYERDQAIGDMIQRVEKKIQLLLEECPSYPDSPETMEAIYTSTFRREKMRYLSASTAELSKAGDTYQYIDLHDSQFQSMEIPQPSKFKEHEERFNIAVGTGEQLAAVDFLECIAPAEMTEEERKTYFTAFNRMVRERYLKDLQINDDGSAEATIPTNLPNIVVKHFYRLGEDMPHESICVSQ